MIFSADTWQVTLFSIAVGLASTLLILPFGITLAWLFARKEWPLKSLFETIVLLPLVMFFGKEVKNSWGTFATSDRFLKEQPKQLAGFVRAVIKGLKVARQDRVGTIVAVTKFSELDKALSTRMRPVVIHHLLC